jgi:hypothetical protein
MARQNRYVNDEANPGSLYTGYPDIAESGFNMGITQIAPKLSWRCSHRDTTTQRLSLLLVIDSAIGPIRVLL